MLQPSQCSPCLRRAATLAWAVVLVSCLRLPALGQGEGDSEPEFSVAKLSLQQKVGQMVFPRLPGTLLSTDDPELREVVALARQGKIGGVILFGGDPLSARSTVDRLQAASAVPLLIGLDAEWGIGMRLQGGTRFPMAMAVGATQDPELAESIGRVTAEEALSLGIHLILAPVLDLAVEPDNRVIGARSFGAEPEAVAELGAAFVRGVQSTGALAVAKHFPGHGATIEDSHFDLPRLDVDLDTLRQRELVPFARAVEAGVAGVMPAHIVVAAVDDDQRPASRSAGVLRGLLREELGFEGLIVSDALDMEGARGEWHGSVAVEAVAAGTDILLLPPYPRVAVNALVRSVARGVVSEAQIDVSVEKILSAKRQLDLLRSKRTERPADSIAARRWAAESVIRTAEARQLALRTAAASVTWIDERVESSEADPHDVPKDGVPQMGVPGDCLGGVAGRRPCWHGNTLVISLLDEFDRQTAPRTVGRELARRSTSVKDFWVRPSSARSRDAEISSALDDADAVMIASYASRRSWGPLPAENRLADLGSRDRSGSQAADEDSAHENPAETLEVSEPDAAAIASSVESPWAAVEGWIEQARERGIPVVFAALRDPWTLTIRSPGRLGLFDGSEASQIAVVQAVFGENSLGGQVPVHVASDGESLSTRGWTQNRFSLDPVEPSNVGMDDGLTSTLKGILQQAVADGTSPGASAVVLRHGQVVFADAVGTLTYDQNAPPVRLGTLFDIASLTKVLVTTTLAMQLEEDGVLALKAPVSRYLPEFNGGGKEAITILDLLTHSSGILWWTDLYQRHGARGEVNASARAGYIIEIASLPLSSVPRTATEYSDLGILLLGEVLERLTGRRLDQLAQERIFEPLAMTATGYRPLEPPLSVAQHAIAPTEVDDAWRRELVWGEVHDENAAGLGGVAPHAGVFSTAEDLARFIQMLMNGGHLDGKRLLKRSTIERYTQPAGIIAGSSRALGWDTPSGRSSAGAYFSAGSFGHTGFTGTSLWIDPQHDVAVILLTNRVHPTRENRQISALRRAVHDAVMLAIDDVEVPPRSAD